MNKICTDIEQSKRLIELGIDVSTADMCWCTRKLQWGEIKETMVAYPMLPILEKSVVFKYIPAWSFTALINVLPQGTRLLKSATDEMYHCDCPKGNIDKWFDNPVDVTFEMVCWLKENKKL